MKEQSQTIETTYKTGENEADEKARKETDQESPVREGEMETSPTEV